MGLSGTRRANGQKNSTIFRSLTRGTWDLTLDQLYLELDQLPSVENSDSEIQRKFESIRESYKNVLEESENHSEYDYFGVMLATYGRSKSNNLTRLQLMRYLAYQIMSLCLSGVVVVFPVAVGLWALKL